MSATIKGVFGNAVTDNDNFIIFWHVNKSFLSLDDGNILKNFSDIKKDLFAFSWLVC